MRWICLVPRGDLLVELREHRRRIVFAEYTHSFREWIAVKRDNSLRGQDRPGQWCRRFHGPSRVFHSRANRGYEREAVLLAAARHRRNSDRDLGRGSIPGG